MVADDQGRQHQSELTTSFSCGARPRAWCFAVNIRYEYREQTRGAVIWPLTAHAQQGEQIRRIGAIIGYARNDPEVQSYVNAFDQGLRELGWTEGRNVRIDYRYAAGDITEMGRLTREMVALQPDVIFASSPDCGRTSPGDSGHPRGVCRCLRSRGRQPRCQPLAAWRQHHRVAQRRSLDEWQVGGTTQRVGAGSAASGHDIQPQYGTGRRIVFCTSV